MLEKERERERELKKLINTSHNKPLIPRRRRSRIRPKLILTTTQVRRQIRQVPNRPHKRRSQKLRRTRREQRRQTFGPITRRKGLLFPRGLHVAGARALRAVRWFCGVVHLAEWEGAWGETAFVREGFGEAGAGASGEPETRTARRWRNQVWWGERSR